MALPVQIPAAQLANAQIQIRLNQGNLGGRNVRRISTRIANGVKEVNAEENGRKVKLVESQAGGIEIEVTETKDGKETTQKYQARDAAELKTKHPDGHKIYEQYGGRGGLPVPVARPVPVIPNRSAPAAPANPNRNQLIPNLDPFAPPTPAIPQPNPIEDQIKRLDESIKSMDNAIERFRGRLPEESDASRRMIESMENSRKRLQEMRARAVERG